MICSQLAVRANSVPLSCPLDVPVKLGVVVKSLQSRILGHTSFQMHDPCFADHCVPLFSGAADPTILHRAAPMYIDFVEHYFAHCAVMPLAAALCRCNVEMLLPSLIKMQRHHGPCIISLSMYIYILFPN